MRTTPTENAQPQSRTRRFASRCSREEQAFTVALKWPPSCLVQPFLVRHRHRSAMLSTRLGRHLKVCAPDNDLADIMRTSAN